MPEKRGIKELHNQLSEQSLELLCALPWEKHNNHSSRNRKAQLNKEGTNSSQGSISPSEQNSRLLMYETVPHAFPELPYSRGENN